MHFTSPINVEGIEVNDLFSINTLLGGTIETQTVMLLNSPRSIWDPQGKRADKEFRRYPESSPDVRLVGSNKDDSPPNGIELKRWYLLSKESEPSLRHKASADAVTERDLICCVPWGLSNVLSGKPVVYEPYAEQAKFASDKRTYYWNHRRGDNSKRDCGIHHPETTPHPNRERNMLMFPIKTEEATLDVSPEWMVSWRIGWTNPWTRSWRVSKRSTGCRSSSYSQKAGQKRKIEAELSNIARKVRQTGRPDHKASMLEEQLLAHLSAIVALSLK